MAQLGSAVPLDGAASVPFESEGLLGTQVRDDERHDLVALLRNFAQNGATYVTPWESLPSMFTMTSFDAALHREVGATGAATPPALREAVRAVAASGAGGPAMQSEAQLQTLRDERRRVRIASLLAERVVSSVGIVPQRLNSGVSRNQLESAFARRGLEPRRVADQIELCATLVSAAGLDPEVDRDTSGPLRILAGQLRHMFRHFEFKSGRSTGDDAAAYSAAAEAARSAAQRCADCLRQLDDCLSQIPLLLSSWDRTRPMIDRLMRQLDADLDGWEPIIAIHAGVLDVPANFRGSRGMLISALLPGPPHTSATPGLCDPRPPCHPSHVS